MGDINDDTVIDGLHGVTWVDFYLFYETNITTEYIDVNGDGIVDLQDIETLLVLIIQFAEYRVLNGIRL